METRCTARNKTLSCLVVKQAVVSGFLLQRFSSLKRHNVYEQMNNSVIMNLIGIGYNVKTYFWDFEGYWFLDFCCRPAWCTVTQLSGLQTTFLQRCWNPREETAIMGESVTGGPSGSSSLRCSLVSEHLMKVIWLNKWKDAFSGHSLSCRCWNLFRTTNKRWIQ